MAKIKKNAPLPDVDHVVRHVPWKALLRDEDDRVLGILPQALELRADESGLSVTHLEHFPGDRSDQISASVGAIRQSRTLKPKCHFAVANVGGLKNVVSEKVKIRIISYPTRGNQAHCEIRNPLQNELEVLETMAAEFDEMYQNSQVS